LNVLERKPIRVCNLSLTLLSQIPDLFHSSQFFSVIFLVCANMIVLAYVLSLLLLGKPGYSGTGPYHRPASRLNTALWHPGPEANKDILVDISIALTMKNTDKVAKELLDISDPSSSNYGKYWTSAKVSKSIRQSEKSYLEISRWIKNSGVNTSKVILSSDGGSVHFALNVRRAAQQLLDTAFHLFTNRDTHEQLVSNTNYRLPDSLSEHIDYITSGMLILPPKRSSKWPSSRLLNTQVNPPPLAIVNCSTYTAPDCLRNLHNIPRHAVTNSSNSLGVFQLSYATWLSEDLYYFFKLFQPELIGQRPIVDSINGG
jgi:tripeptidyl-peptidase-1